MITDCQFRPGRVSALDHRASGGCEYCTSTLSEDARNADARGASALADVYRRQSAARAIVRSPWGIGATVLVEDLDGTVITARVLAYQPESVEVIDITATAEDGSFPVSPSKIVGLVAL